MAHLIQDGGILGRADIVAPSLGARARLVERAYLHGFMHPDHAALGRFAG